MTLTSGPSRRCVRAVPRSADNAIVWSVDEQVRDAGDQLSQPNQTRDARHRRAREFETAVDGTAVPFAASMFTPGTSLAGVTDSTRTDNFVASSRSCMSRTPAGAAAALYRRQPLGVLHTEGRSVP